MPKTMTFENGKVTVRDEDGNKIATEDVNVVIKEDDLADLMKRYRFEMFRPRTDNVVYVDFNRKCPLCETQKKE